MSLNCEFRWFWTSTRLYTISFEQEQTGWHKAYFRAGVGSGLGLGIEPSDWEVLSWYPLDQNH